MLQELADREKRKEDLVVSHFALLREISGAGERLSHKDAKSQGRATLPNAL